MRESLAIWVKVAWRSVKWWGWALWRKSKKAKAVEPVSARLAPQRTMFQFSPVSWSLASELTVHKE